MKSWSSRIFVWFFVIAGLAEILGQLMDFPYPRHATKPFIIPFLMAYFLTRYGFKSTISKWLMVALFFSWIGDFLLIYQDEKPSYFMVGLFSFLIALIVYTIIYSKMAVSNSESKLLRTQKARYAFILGLIGVAIYTVLYPSLGGLKIPVIFYILSIIFLVITAVYRYGRTSQLSFVLTLTGALLFLVSDSLIAFNKFLDPIPLGGFWIMLTYMLAQYFMGEGLMQHLKVQGKK